MLLKAVNQGVRLAKEAIPDCIFGHMQHENIMLGIQLCDLGAGSKREAGLRLVGPQPLLQARFLLGLETYP